jgi:hypothetical protein
MKGLSELHPGYVWQRETGDRIVIIVDDDVEVFKRNRESLADISNAMLRVYPREQPLIDFYEGLKGLSPIKAIGFFPLPRPKDNDHQQKQEIVAAIRQWIKSFGADISKIWLFVDYFYGDGFEQSTVSGEGFVDFWLEQQWQTENTKIAYFSVGGKTKGGSMVRENHHEYPVISKPKMQDEGVSHYKELVSFLEIGTTQLAHPIEHLFSLSKTWFSAHNQGNEIALTSHHLPHEWNEAEPLTQRQIAAYRESIQDALGISEIPDAWLKSGSLQNLHEAFKHLCGAYSCGQADPQRTSRQNISTGAAYLVALMAYHRACSASNPFLDSKSEVWSLFKQVKAPLFPIQDDATAKASAKALYDFFLHLFQPKFSATSVKKVSLYEEGRAFKIQLTWDMKSDPERSLAQLLKRSIRDGSVPVPKTASNTREASSRLLAQMAVNQNGLGSPGTIYMDGDELTIASLIIK